MFSCPLEPLCLLRCSMCPHASVLPPLLGIAFPSFSGQQASIHLSKPSKTSSPSETMCSWPFAPFPLVPHQHMASSTSIASPTRYRPYILCGLAEWPCARVQRTGALESVTDPNSALITSWPCDLKQMCNFSKSRVSPTYHENNCTETTIIIPAQHVWGTNQVSYCTQRSYYIEGYQHAVAVIVSPAL